MSDGPRWGDRVVRPPSGHDTDRYRIAQRSLEAERARLVDQVGEHAGDPAYVWHHAVAVIEGDDDYGRALAWVVYGDLVRWADLVAVARAAVEQLDPAHVGQDVVDCPACDLRRAVGRLRRSAQTAQRAGVDLPTPAGPDPEVPAVDTDRRQGSA